MILSPLPTSDAMASASGQGEFLKKRSVNLFQLKRNKIGSQLDSLRLTNIATSPWGEVLLHIKQSSLPVLIDILDLIDLLLNALAGYTVGLQLVNLLVDQVRDGFVEILQEVLDHLWDDVVGLLLILPLIGEVCFGITCKEMGE